MDCYHYGNSSSIINDVTTTTASNSTNEDNAIISYHQQQQLQSFSYNNDDHNNNEFHGQTIDTNNMSSATTIQLLDSPTDEIFHRLQQRWDIHNSSSSNSHMLTSSEIINNEELNQHHERGIAGFVSKLYQCLQALDDGHKYARWCRHNGIDMFIIDCIPKFTEIVLPRLFKHCKFASFVRQLNIYGFQRDTDARKSKDSKDKETCRWHHIHFRPGRRDLFHLIRRKTPRYSRSRRKRSKMTENNGEEEEGKDLEDDDPETILYTGSGEDDEVDSNIILLDEGTQSSGFDDTHRSASLVSSPTILQQQRQQQGTHTNYRQQQLQMIYDGSPQELVVDNYLQVTQPQSSSTTSSPQYCHFPSNNNINCSTTKSMMPLISIPTLPNGSEIVDDSKNNVNDPNELFLFQQATTHHHQQLQHQQQENEVDNLQSEIEQLRKGYLKMYKMLSSKVDKAAHLISSQRLRIEYLENVIRNNNNINITQQQQPLQSVTHQTLPFIDTSTASSNDSSSINYFTSNNSNDSSGGIPYHHSSANTTPTTPICPQVAVNSAIHQNVIQQQLSSSNSGNSRVLNEGYNFLFSNNTSNNSNNSSNANDSKLSISNGKWTSTSQNLGLIQRNNNHL